MLGPLGRVGVLTVSELMVTVFDPDDEETTLVWVAHLAWALTYLVPVLLQEWEALVEDDQLE